MIVHEKAKPDQIYTLVDKAYYVDQIKYKIDIWEYYFKQSLLYSFSTLILSLTFKLVLFFCA